MNSLEKKNMTKLSKAHKGLRRPVLFMLAGFFFASFAGETAARFQSSASLASAAEPTDDTPLAHRRMKRLVIQPETLKFDKIPARMSENATVTVGNPNSVDAQIRAITYLTHQPLSRYGQGHGRADRCPLSEQFFSEWLRDNAHFLNCPDASLTMALYAYLDGERKVSRRLGIYQSVRLSFR